jgi:hypothetical protein
MADTLALIRRNGKFDPAQMQHISGGIAAEKHRIRAFEG